MYNFSCFWKLIRIYKNFHPLPISQMSRVGGDVPCSLSTHRQFETELHFSREKRVASYILQNNGCQRFHKFGSEKPGQFDLVQFSIHWFSRATIPSGGRHFTVFFFSRGRLQAQRGAGSSGQFTEPWTCLTSLCTNYVRLLAKNRHRYREERAFRSFSKMKSLRRWIIDASASVMRNAKIP